MISLNASECMMKKPGFKAERKTQILQNVLIWVFPIWVQSNIKDREKKNKGFYQLKAGSTTFGRTAELEWLLNRSSSTRRVFLFTNGQVKGLSEDQALCLEARWYANTVLQWSVAAKQTRYVVTMPTTPPQFKTSLLSHTAKVPCANSQMISNAAWELNLS